MEIEQLYLGCLAQASYLVVDKDRKTAAIIDPRRDIDIYIQEAEKRGAKIQHVLLTHFHADFVSGHIELMKRTGATIAMGAKGQPEYEHRALSEGDCVEFGNVRLKALETPGHTPESICIVAYDSANAPDTPVAVFTGDTLFVGDVGRPDLMSSIGVTAEELAGSLYDSLHHKLMKLPDETIVYPGHGAGSMCGKNLSSDTSTTIGAQRKLNYALAPMSREQFIAEVTANQPEAPAYFGFDAMLNRQERATLEERMQDSNRALSKPDFLREAQSNVQIVDVRAADEFAQRHLGGSINIGLDGKYATWAGTVLDKEKPILVIAPAGREQEAIVRLGRIGYDHVRGYLEGGIDSLQGEATLTETRRINTEDLNQEIDTVLVLDIRNTPELEGGYIEDSLHIPLGQLSRRLDEIPRDKPIAIICGSGYRSSIGASMMEGAGFENLTDIRGGMIAWNENSFKTVQPVS